MANPTYSDIYNDVGDLQDAVRNGTTAVKAQITKAQGEVSQVTGTTTGYDNAIRNLACVYVVNAVLGGMGPETNTDDLREMRDEFKSSAENSLIRKGYAFDGISVKFERVNS